jgi:predicted ATPase
MAELPSGTVTFLFTDIEGSTRLLEELGESYGAALMAHRTALRAAFGAHGGVEVDNQGDAFFFVFPDAQEAAAGAAAGQESLGPGPVRVRMGLHTGTPSRTDEGYFGRDVNIGARVAASAHGRQVVLTKATHDLLDGAVVTDLGEHRVKDFDEPVWIYQLGAENFPPLKTISNTNLPRPASAFVGREREVGEVQKRVRESRFVTLTGPGGSGKTRLSIETATELVGEFKSGVFWVGLATVHDPAAVLPAIEQTLGYPPTDIGERELLLVLDNLEQVVECAPGLASLVVACPNLRLLVTSRELLRVRGETEYEVLPLDDLDAAELFFLRSGLETTPAIEELCRRLDNMPLALELAAARTKALTPEQILERLGRRLDLFQGGRDAEERQRTLRATIEWSYELLSAAERALFARLGVFVGGCTLDAAENVAGAALETIQSLVEKSLVRHTEGRFWMLETIREYAVERLAELSDAEAVRRRFAEHCLGIAEQGAMNVEATEAGRPPQQELVAPERANIRSALDWCTTDDPELGLRLASELEQFWVTVNPFEGAERLAGLLERGADAPLPVRARAWRCLGGSRYMSHDVQGSIAANEQALALYRAESDEHGEATTLFRLGTSIIDSDPERARAHLQESLELSRRLGKQMTVVEASGNLARMEFDHGDRALGRRLVEKNIEEAREIGFMWWVAGQQVALGFDSLASDDLDDAEQRATDSLRLNRGMADRGGSVTCIGLLAAVAARRGDPDRAGLLWGAVEAEEGNGPLGHGWETYWRPLAEPALSEAAGPSFESGRRRGLELSLADAEGVVLAGRNRPAPTSS